MSREELVEKMASAYEEGAAFPLGTPHGIHAARVKGMAAALDVAVGELLGDCTEDEWVDHKLTMTDCGRPRAGIVRESLKNLFTSRRSRYLKPKSAEDRVTIKDYPIDHFIKKLVQLDGMTKAEFLMPEDAEIYRLGLIQQLKQQRHTHRRRG